MTFAQSTVTELKKTKKQVEKAIAQVSDDDLHWQVDEESNSIAIIMKHMAGNMRSRWTGFLTSDGEKPDRDRDQEFQLIEADTRGQLMAAWERGWAALWTTLESLSEGDLGRTVTIRGEAHTVRQALLRGATHVAYHTGQILYVVRLLRPESRWLTMAPGQSQNRAGDYLHSRTEKQ